MERKLASVRRISKLAPIPNADAIEVATVDGWQVVVKKGEFVEGQLAVYFEIDSWIPCEVAPFLCKAVKTFNGVQGERLRTVKLRGQLSQGLLLPLLAVLPIARETTTETNVDFRTWTPWEAGDDVTEILKIQKYEKPLSPQLAGLAKGTFPSFLKKTDQERIQNLTHEFEDWKARGLTFEVTEKLDGSSMTVFFKDGQMGVCSRNLELKEDDTNTFWKVAKQGITLEGVDAEQIVESAIQGELVGPGIQGNPYNLSSHQMFVFDIWLIEPSTYADAEVRRQTVANDSRLRHVPVISTGTKLPDTIAEVLAMSDGQSTLAPVPREGLVWKCEQDPSISFKAISNKWLLKEKD